MLFSGGAGQELDIDLVYRRELVVRGLRSSTPRHLREALALIASGAVDCESLVDCVLDARRVRGRPRALPQPRGAQGGVRAVIAARYWAPRDVRVEHVPEPSRARARSCCDRGGADLRDRRQVLPPRPPGAARAVAGALRARVLGVVVACGEDAPFSEGDRVCGANSSPCGVCRACTAGREELCSDLYPLLNGAYAELLRVPARIARVNLYRVPDGVPHEVAAAIEPLACAVHGADDADARSPASTSPCSAAGRSAACSPSPARLAARSAELLGRGEGAPRSYETRDRGGGARPRPGRRRSRLAAPGGTVVLFGGLPRETVVPVDSYRLHYEALDAARLLPPPPARRAHGARAARARGLVDHARCSPTSSRSPTWSSRCAAARASRRATDC